MEHSSIPLPLHRPLLVLVLACLLSYMAPFRSIALAAEEQKRQEIDLSRVQDTRLRQRITRSSAPVYVGELLEQIRQETAVPVRADSASGADRERLAVFVRDIPAGELLEGIRSLFSYRTALWHWERREAKSEVEYVLVRSSRARNFAQTVRGDIQAGFERHAATMMAALDAKPRSRDRILSQDSAAQTLFSDTQIQQGLTLFSRYLSDAERQAVLSGQREVELPLDRLSESDRHFVQGLSRQNNIQLRDEKTGKPIPLPEPASVRFLAQRLPGTLSPTLFVVPGNSAGSGYLGGDPYHRVWLDNISRSWLTDGDEIRDARDMTEIPPGTPGGGADDRLIHRLQELSQNSPGVNVLLRLPISRGVITNIARTPVHIGDLRTPPAVTAMKWRYHTLLLCDPSWIATDDEEAKAPWEVVKSLRSPDARTSDGFLSLKTLSCVATQLQEKQLKALGTREFPILATIAPLRDLFAWAGRSDTTQARLLTPDGVPAGEIPESVRRVLRLDTAIANTPDLHLRLREEITRPTADRSVRVLHIEGVDSAGDVQYRARLSELRQAGRVRLDAL